MSSLYVRVTINQHRTHLLYGPAMAAHLRSLADQVESAVGPIDLTTDWADIEAWSIPEAELPPLAEGDLPRPRLGPVPAAPLDGSPGPGRVP